MLDSRLAEVDDPELRAALAGLGRAGVARITADRLAPASRFVPGLAAVAGVMGSG